MQLTISVTMTGEFLEESTSDACRVDDDSIGDIVQSDQNRVSEKELGNVHAYL